MEKPVFWSDYICIKVPFGWQQSLSVVVKETAYKMPFPLDLVEVGPL